MTATVGSRWRLPEEANESKLRILLIGDSVDRKVVEDLCLHFKPTHPETPEWNALQRMGKNWTTPTTETEVTDISSMHTASQKQQNLACDLRINVNSNGDSSGMNSTIALLAANLFIPGTHMHGPYYRGQTMPDITASMKAFRYLKALGF